MSVFSHRELLNDLTERKKDDRIILRIPEGKCNTNKGTYPQIQTFYVTFSQLNVKCVILLHNPCVNVSEFTQNYLCESTTRDRS